MTHDQDETPAEAVAYNDRLYGGSGITPSWYPRGCLSGAHWCIRDLTGARIWHCIRCDYQRPFRGPLPPIGRRTT